MFFVVSATFLLSRIIYNAIKKLSIGKCNSIIANIANTIHLPKNCIYLFLTCILIAMALVINTRALILQTQGKIIENSGKTQTKKDKKECRQTWTYAGYLREAAYGAVTFGTMQTTGCIDINSLGSKENNCCNGCWSYVWVIVFIFLFFIMIYYTIITIYKLCNMINMYKQENAGKTEEIDGSEACEQGFSLNEEVNDNITNKSTQTSTPTTIISHAPTDETEEQVSNDNIEQRTTNSTSPQVMVYKPTIKLSTKQLTSQYFSYSQSI